MQTVWDPLRKKEIALTPEEQVRQSFIVYLRDSLGVPTSLMNSEVFLKYGQKPFRADILVFDRKGEPLMLVECKRPDVKIDVQVLRQALNYHAVLNIRYLVLTNGKTSYLYGRNKGGEFESLRTFPKYEEMICR